MKIDKNALEDARKQFCLDIGMNWEEYLADPKQKVYIKKASYKKGTCLVDMDGARVYEGRCDFFHAMICLGQLFLVVDEQIYDWAVERFRDYPVEWFCEFANLRAIEEKLKEYGHAIQDTHVYMLPGECDPMKMCAENTSLQEAEATSFVWYDQDEIMEFQVNNRFTSAICFSKTQPDMLAVAAVSGRIMSEKPSDQSLMKGMAGVSADGAYLWQIGINVIPEASGKGLATKLVEMIKDEIQKQGITPFYGTSESHTISQTVGLKAGFVPAWTEVYAR